MMRWLAATLPLCLAMVTPDSAAEAATPPLSPGWEGYARTALQNGECFTATSLVERAIAAGDPIGYSVRGEMYESGRCAERSWSKAAQAYADALSRGHWFVKGALGYLALHGRGIAKDVAWAKRLFRSFALDLALAEPEHRPILLRALMRHRGIPRELEEAMAWVREIETSDARTLYEMALKLKAGLDGLPPHEQRARDWMSDAANTGLVAAQYTLAMWQLEEPRDEHDIESGLFSLFFLAEQGHVQALEEYGRRLAEGRDVVRNDRDAYIVLMRAQAAGAHVEDILNELRRRLPTAQLTEAEIVLKRSSLLPLAQVVRSSEDSRELETSPESDYQAALSILRGSRSCVDVDRALIRLYNLSQDGYLPALLEYARQLAEGTCIARDELSAYTVLLLAERAGAEMAEFQQRLASRLTSAQRQEAQLRADIRLVPFYRLEKD